MAFLGQKIVRNFLEERGYEVVKIPECDIKTPDFKVFLNGKLIFYCEEKTLEYDDFEGCKKDPTYNSISAHVHKATKQFKSINPLREHPNVIAFVNFDPSKDINDLFITLTGCAFIDNGEYMRIHRVGRIANDLNQIDLFLWFDNEQFTNKIWTTLNDEQHTKLSAILYF